MKITINLLLSLGLTLSTSQVNAKLPTTNNNLIEIYNNLNLASFRNSTGPKRYEGDKYFSDLGLALTNIEDDHFEVEEESWMYRVRLITSEDKNNDGINDFIICFHDKSEDGSYDSKQSLLISRIHDNTGLIALKYEVNAC